MRKRKSFKVISGILFFLIFSVSLVFIFRLTEKIIDFKNHADSSLHYSDSGEDRVFWEGNWYSRNDGLESVLILGIDAASTVDGTSADSSQADFIAVLVIDKLEKSYRLLHINRDTMTEITQLDEEGKSYGTFEAQIALAHAYGSTDTLKCRNTVAAVENLLYGVDIHHYFSMTMDAIPLLNDAVGGVTVTLSQDFPPLGENALAGKEIRLHGDDALTFVRWRSNDPSSSNLERMERQRAYISAMAAQYEDSAAEDIADILMTVSQYIFSDYTLNQMSVLMERLQTYTYEGTVSVAGEAKKGDTYVEFYVDEPALQRTVVEYFYRLKK